MDLIRERMRCTPMGAALRFGGDSESSSDTWQQDRRTAAGDMGAAVSGDRNTVVIAPTDFGAVQSGIEAARYGAGVAKSAAQITAATVRDVFERAADSNDSARDAALDAFSQSLNATRAAFGDSLAEVGAAYETAKAGDQRIVSMVGLAVVALAALAMFAKGR